MGLNIRSVGNHKTYITIRDGKVIKPVKANTQNAVARQKKDSKELVYELHYNNVSGYVSNCKVQQTDFGKRWVIEITDGIDDYILTMPYSGATTFSLLNRLLNADVKRELSIEPYCFTPKDGNKEMRGVVLRYAKTGINGNLNEKVTPYSTKDNPRDMPEMVQVTVKGEMTWDDTTRNEWLERMFQAKFYEMPQEQPQKQESKTDDFLVELEAAEQTDYYRNVYLNKDRKEDECPY